MSVRIPMEVSTTGADTVKKIKEEIAKTKEEVKEIGKSVDSTTESTTTTTPGKKKDKKNPTKIDKALEQDLGFGQAQNILSYGTNPSAAILAELGKIGTLPLTLIGIPKVAEATVALLQQEGAFFDRFFDDRIDNRTDAFRDKTQQQIILQGFDALRISTIDGDTDPRNLYNSFEVFENDRTLLENDFKIRKSVDQ